MTPAGNPLLRALCGDDEVEHWLDARSELAAIARFEAALARAQASVAVIPANTAQAIAAGLAAFAPDMDRLAEGMRRDGVVVPELVRQMRAAVGPPHNSYVHHGATSQDAIDSALMLRLAAILPILDARLGGLADDLADLDRRWGGRPLQAHTRMQPALAMSVADRVHSWRAPIAALREQLERDMPGWLAVQLGGAVGTLDVLGDRGAAVRAALARELGLADAAQWHSQRGRIAEIAGWLARVTGSLGKLGQDMALMAQAGKEITLSGGGGSSAMPHKQNPVAAEVLVTLARFNAVQVSGIHQAMVHEQERSGSAWTLEWMILPPMIAAAGGATLTASRLIGSITSIGSPRQDGTEPS